MTDKEKIHQILSSLWKNDDSVGKVYYNQALQDVQTTIDLQEEPVSEDLEEAIDTYLKSYWGGEKEKQDWPFLKKMVIYFANWQKTKNESTMEDLGEYINKLSKQFPEVSFAKLSRIAVRVAKWQKVKDKKNYC